MIDIDKFKAEVVLFQQALSPKPEQKTVLKVARVDALGLIANEARKNKCSEERALLTALCGQLDTDKQKAEFVGRLILLDILLDDVK